MNIVAAISRDKQEPSHRADLARRFGISDRDVRRQIASARREGERIVALPTGGYYVAEDPQEWNDFCARERKRALATFKKAVPLPSADGEQMTI